jgi:hypothetical protein
VNTLLLYLQEKIIRVYNTNQSGKVGIYFITLVIYSFYCSVIVLQLSIIVIIDIPNSLYKPRLNTQLAPILIYNISIAINNQRVLIFANCLLNLSKYKEQKLFIKPLRLLSLWFYWKVL